MVAAVPLSKMYAATTPTDKTITAQHENKHAIACRTKNSFLHTLRRRGAHPVM